MWGRRPKEHVPDRAPDQSAAPPSPADALTAAGVEAPRLWWLGDLPTREPLWVFWSDAADTTDWWLRLRAVHDRTGLWPVALGNEIERDVFTALGPRDEFWVDPQEELARARELDLAGALALVDDTTVEDHGDPAGEYDARVPDAVEPADTEVDHRAEGWMALVRVDDPSDVPALLGWIGGCNYDLRPSTHVAVLRAWRDEHGAELMALGSDQSMVLAVARPPTQPGEAYRVALQHFRYCYDTVAQGTESLHDLAQQHVPSRIWAFWWD